MIPNVHYSALFLIYLQIILLRYALKYGQKFGDIT